ncbi:MAG: TRAP transporter fused permease subunit [Cyanobacteria bacterium J06626_18]
MKLLNHLVGLGRRRQLTGRLRLGAHCLAALIAIAVVGANSIWRVDMFSLTIIFLGAMLALTFLTVGASPKGHPTQPSPVDWALVAMALATGLYFFIENERIITRITLFDPLTLLDLGFGTVLLLLTIEAMRRTVGLGLTVIVLSFIAYNLWGHWLTGIFSHGLITYSHFLDITVFTTDGLFGVALRVAATYAFLFVLFGTVLNRTGGTDFFFNLAAALSGSSPGGPAKIAVISSALYGMLSGSPTSDVVTTGSVTIPIMKRLGYRPELAAGIEVAASTGGSLLPPVMGSAAFIMAEYTGIEYRQIAIAAIVPSLLFYVCVFTQIHLYSVKAGLSGLEQGKVQRLTKTLQTGGLFLVPLGVITVALLWGYSPNFVAIFGTLSVLFVAMLHPRTRIGLVGIWNCLAEATLHMIPVVAACAAAGLVIGGISMTGLASKFADLVLLLAGGQSWGAIVTAAALTILLGMGMPTPSAYILAAVLVGPTLTGMGIPVLPANLFLLYFAALSAMTPPVAVAAFAAAAIADSNPLQTGVIAVRLAATAFVVPFAFIYRPDFLLLAGEPAVVLSCFTAVIGVVLIAVGIEGYLHQRLSIAPRMLLGLTGLALLVPSGLSLILAAVLLTVAVVICPSLRRYVTHLKFLNRSL